MDTNNSNPQSNNNNKEPKKKFNIIKINLNWFFLIIGFTLIGLYYFSDTVATKEVSLSEFERLVSDGAIDRMVVFTSKNSVDAYIKPTSVKKVFNVDTTQAGNAPKVIVKIPSADKFADYLKTWEEQYQFKPDIRYEEGSDYFGNFLWSFGPLILLGFLWIYFMRRMSSGGGSGGGMGGIFSVGKAKAQLFDKENSSKITFKDVAGLSEAKEEIEEIVAFLKNPSRYTELGGKIPKGALLVGPPGTGKTLLAKAVAGEADVPFFSMSGSDFVEMFVGVGASRVRDLFRQAKEKAPCIVFIDEIDAVGRARGKNPNMGANDERENTLNQLLTEMDGFGSNSGVIILAATNRADVLDKALLRAGRFDRQIHVELPDINDRKAIFAVHLRPIKIDDTTDTTFLARQTPGFSGADIANVCNEAALIAARRGKTAVGKDDFLAAVDRIIGGLEKKSRVMTATEKRSIAVHESGHATLSWFLEHAHPLIKVTIVPRGKALGAAWYLPEERQITTQQQMLDEICSTLGGRAAEELFLGRISTGAINDLERVTKQAYAMVAYFGMSEKLPNLSYYDSMGNEYNFSKPYSDVTAQIIDKEVSKIIEEQYQRAKDLLTQYSEGHHKLTEKLIEFEVIFKEDLEEIFGMRQWTSRSEEILEAGEKKETEEKKAEPAAE